MKKIAFRGFLLVFFIFTFSSCVQHYTSKDNYEINKMISNLQTKFPQLPLPKSPSKPTDFYKFSRSIKNGLYNFEVQLYTSPDDDKYDRQEIIIIINKLGKKYAIPLFSNAYAFRDYWNFEYDKPFTKIDKNIPTFESELMKALDSLKLNDSIATGHRVIVDIFNSLLECKTLNESDISKIKVSEEPHDPKFENCEDGCDAKYKKNHNTILERYHKVFPQEKFYYNPTLRDFKRKRIYQFTYCPDKMDSLNFNVYRFECDCQYIGIIL